MNGDKEKKLYWLSADTKNRILREGRTIYLVRDKRVKSQDSSDVEPKTSIYKYIGSVDVPSDCFAQIAEEHFGAYFIRGDDPEWELTLPRDIDCEGLDKMVQIYTTGIKRPRICMCKKCIQRTSMGRIYNETESSDEHSSSDSFPVDKINKTDREVKKGQRRRSH